MSSESARISAQRLGQLLKSPRDFTDMEALYDESNKWAKQKGYYWEDRGPYPGNVYRCALIRLPFLTILKESTSSKEARIDTWISALAREEELDPKLQRGKDIVVILNDGRQIRTKFNSHQAGIIRTKEGDIQMSEVRLITLQESPDGQY